MRKLIASIILFVMVATLATTVVRATTASTLADDLYKVGAKYGMTSAHKVKIEQTKQLKLWKRLEQQTSTN